MEAADELIENYDENLIGKIVLNVVTLHLENQICYKLSKEASKAYEKIINRYNEQFNLKYSGKYLLT